MTSVLSDAQYGLISAGYDRFFAFAKTEEYEILKFVQLLISKFDLFYIIDITNLKKENIDLDHDPVNFTLNGARRIHVEPDVDTHRLCNLQLIQASEPTAVHYDIRKKIIFLFNIVRSLLLVYKNMSTLVAKEMQQENQGLAITKKFLFELLGHDDRLEYLIDRDIKELQLRQSMLDNEKSRILNILLEIDYDLTNEENKKILAEKIGPGNSRGSEFLQLRYLVYKSLNA
jgi:hypothetical protein